MSQPRPSLRTLLVGAALLALALQAAEPWTKPPQTWTAEEALKIVKDSPWAHPVDVLHPRTQVATHVTISVPLGQKPSRNPRPDTVERREGIPHPSDPAPPPWDPSARDFVRASYLVRWESAAAVAAAFARLEELGERSSARFQAPAPRRPADRYVISVKTLVPPNQGSDLFDGLSDAELQDRARLATAADAVAPLEVERSGKGAAAAVHFYFPRVQNGQPLLRGPRPEVEFVFTGKPFPLTTEFELEGETP